MTIGDLRKRLRFWKRALNLQSWTIYVSPPKAGELLDDHAQMLPFGQHERCRIIIHEGEYAEYWLLHEICHIVLDQLNSEPESKAAQHLEEIAANRIARALCTAYNVRTPPWKDLFDDNAKRSADADKK
jgi:hypothetical protein